MLESQREQEERQRTLDNDRRLREQGGSTFFDHTSSDAGGRFTQQGAATVIGSKAAAYPAASAARQTRLPDEPPLSFDNPALEPSSTSVEGIGGPVDVPSDPLGVERTAVLTDD